MALDYVDLTLDLYDGQGNALRGGTATFTLSAEIVDTVDHEIVTAAPIVVNIQAGLPVVHLLANDSPNLQPTGTVWTVVFNGVPGNPAEFSFSLSQANGANQFLSSQSPVSVAPQASPYLSASLNLADVPDKAAALTNLGMPTQVTSVNGATGDVSLGAADLGAIPAGSVGTTDLVASTGDAGFALQNGTPTILSYTVPDDGNAHRLFVFAMRMTSSGLTGGTLNATGTAPNGAAISSQIQGGGQGVGSTNGNGNFLVQSGSTFHVVQGSAATAGAATQYVDIWEWTPSSQIVTPSPPPSQSSLLFGTDNGSFAAMKSVIPQMKVSRIYNDVGAGIPSTWPGNSVATGVTRRVVSFRPDVPGTIAGTHDAAIKAYMALAPAGDYLCAYHEGNSSTNVFRTSGYTATQFTQLHTKLKALRDASNPGLKIGQILLTSPTAQSDSPWVTPGLDWYGIDGYAGSQNKTAATIFDTSIQNVLNVQADALLCITETNASQGTNAQWNQWFDDVFSIAKAHGMSMVLTWWGGSPTSNPPSFSTTGPYVPTLQSLAASL